MDFVVTPLGFELLGGQVLILENVPDLVARDLATFCISLRLHDPRKLNLQFARQIESVIGLEQVSNPTLTRLGINTNHCLIGAPNIFGVDRQIRDSPFNVIYAHARCLRGGFHRFKALLNGVLVRPAKGRVHQVASPRTALWDRQLIAVFSSSLDLI